MRLADYIGLGMKNIWRHKARSALTILAVVIGAISITIMLSLVIGAQRVATQQLESIGGFTLISVSANPDAELNGNLLSTDTGQSEGVSQLNDSTVEKLRSIPHVMDATPISGVWIKSLRLDGQTKKHYSNLVAYIPGNKVLDIPVTAGRKLAAGDMDKIVISSDTLKAFGYTDNPGAIIGKKVLLSVQGPTTAWEADPPRPPENGDKSYFEGLQGSREISAEIIGVSTTGPESGQDYITMDWGRLLMSTKEWRFNDTIMNELKQKQEQINQQYQQQKETLKQSGQSPDQLNIPQINMSVAQQLETHNNIQEKGYPSILVKADSTDTVTPIAENIRKMGFGVQTAKDMLDQIKKMFVLVGAVIGALGGISLFVAAIGIINTMIMATYERTREIGVLRACGATKKTIKRLFLFEAAMIGFWGGVIGIAASYGLAKIANLVGNQIAVSQGIPINNIMTFPPWLVIGVIALTTIIGTVSGWLPAVHAANLDPVEALRYE